MSDKPTITQLAPKLTIEDNPTIAPLPDFLTLISQKSNDDIWNEISARKNAGINLFKAVDMKTRSLMKNYKQTMDSLFDSLERVMSASNQRHQTLVNYFNSISVRFGTSFSLSTHIEQFAPKLPPQTPIPGTERTSHLAPNKISTLSNGLSVFESELKEFGKSFFLLDKRIKNQVVTKILYENTKSSENDVRTLHAEMETVRGRLHQNSLTITDALSKLLTEFKSGFAAFGRPKKDTLQFVLGFVIELQQLFSWLKEYGRLFGQLYRELRKLELLRIQSSKQAIECFVKIVKEHFGEAFLNLFPESLKQLPAIDEEVLLRATFDPNLVFNEADRKEVLSVTELSLFDDVAVDKYWMGMAVQETVDAFLSGFVARRYAGNVIMTKHANENEHWIFMSVDLFYVVFDAGRKGSSPLLFCVPVEEVSVKTEYGNDTVTFAFEEKGLIWNSQKRFPFLITSGDITTLKQDHKIVVRLLTGNGEVLSRLDESVQHLKSQNTSEVLAISVKSETKQAEVAKEDKPIGEEISDVTNLRGTIQFPVLDESKSQVLVSASFDKRSQEELEKKRPKEL